jgi:hypothetical protein
MADYKVTDALTKALNKYHSINYGVTAAGSVVQMNSWLQRGWRKLRLATAGESAGAAYS